MKEFDPIVCRFHDAVLCARMTSAMVDHLPGSEPTRDAELVCVLATGDAGLIAVAKSLLEGDEIDYFVKGDGLQDLFGLGRISGFNYAMGPAEFWVREEDADRARELLASLTVNRGDNEDR